MVALFLGAAPSSYSRPLRVAFVGDPQADGMRQLEYCRKTIYKELRERKDLDLVIVLGDLVNDQVDLLEPTKASLDSLPCPWFCVPGNHDRDVYPKVDGRKRPRGISTYRKVIGYEDTTFVKGGIRFILMNDVRLGGKEYDGGFRNSQKVWLDSVLRATSKNMLAVLSVHIPVTQFAAKDSLSAILSVHPNLLLMSGHTHKVERKYLHLENLGAASGTFNVSGSDALEIPEVQAGATCGLFWLGVKDETGFPAATMPCGAPRGYYVADFKRNGKYSLAYKTVLRDDIASVWVKDGSDLIVNVYGGAPDGQVSVKIPGRRGWFTAVREERTAPEALAVIERNKSIPKKIGSERNPEYIPMREKKSPHIWSAGLDKPLDASSADSVKSGRNGSLRTSMTSFVKLRYRDPYMSFKATVPLKVCL